MNLLLTPFLRRMAIPSEDGDSRNSVVCCRARVGTNTFSNVTSGGINRLNLKIVLYRGFRVTQSPSESSVQRGVFNEDILT